MCLYEKKGTRKTILKTIVQYKKFKSTQKKELFLDHLVLCEWKSWLILWTINWFRICINFTFLALPFNSRHLFLSDIKHWAVSTLDNRSIESKWRYLKEPDSTILIFYHQNSQLMLSFKILKRLFQDRQYFFSEIGCRAK